MFKILGQYNTQTKNIGIDAASHLFADDSPVVFHEITHRHLATYTNEGAVQSILAEYSTPPKKLIVEKEKVQKTLKLLYDDMYLAQEGFAHLMQAFKIWDKDGKQGVKN